MQKAESKGERNNVKMRTRTKKFNTVLVVIFFAGLLYADFAK